jgi:hypothetical protein
MSCRIKEQSVHSGYFVAFPGSLFTNPFTVKQVKLTRFELQSSALYLKAVSTIGSGLRSNVYWFPVKVPSTVLTGLVANNIYPDPYQGMNNMLIPDASDEFNKKYNLEQYSHLPNDPNPWKKPYWYRSTFDVPAADKGKFFQLIFKGINYRAAVWVNGRQIADSSDMAGMFAQHSLDITRHIRAGEKNALAVKIYPLDYPGLPDTEQLEALGDFYLNGGPTGDIGKNVTMVCSVGWDWVPPVRDRNMGIWLPVYLRTTGSVTIGNPRIATQFTNETDTTMAKLSLSMTLFNHGNSEENGNLLVKISPENFPGESFQFSKSVTLSSRGRSLVEFNPDNASELLLKNPVLWWPNGYGKRICTESVTSNSNGSGITDDPTSFLG